MQEYNTHICPTSTWNNTPTHDDHHITYRGTIRVLERLALQHLSTEEAKGQGVLRLRQRHHSPHFFHASTRLLILDLLNSCRPQCQTVIFFFNSRSCGGRRLCNGQRLLSLMRSRLRGFCGFGSQLGL